MKKLAMYVQHLVRHDAQAVILLSGSPVTARFATGDRSSNQPLDHGQLVGIVREAAPGPVFAELMGGRPARFPFEDGGVTVQVDVIPSANVWRVTMTPAQSGGAVAASAPPKPARARGPSQHRLAAAAARPAQPPAAPVEAPQAAAPQPTSKHARAERGPTPDFGPAGMDRWLKMIAHIDASDLHLATNNPVMARLHGEIQKIDGDRVLTEDELHRVMYAIMPERTREEFERTHDTDWAYEIKGLARFRCNAFMDRMGIGGVFRRIPFEIVSPEKLGIPKQVLELCQLTKGLVLVTGPTGCGKSTTLATLVDVCNSTRDDHIITIEDPIEFVHQNKRCLVNQREVHVHTDSFKRALRAALREDPDVVLVGELRDLETIAIAIETAETGHLVFGTLHTSSAPSTVDRIIDQFPPAQQEQIRAMLATSLKGVISQVLCKKIGGGRGAAYEVMIGTSAVENLIREGKTFQLPGVLQTSRNVGMCTMNDSLIALTKKGVIEPREAWMKAYNKAEMRSLFAENALEIPQAS